MAAARKPVRKSDDDGEDDDDEIGEILMDPSMLVPLLRGFHARCAELDGGSTASLCVLYSRGPRITRK